MSVDVLVAIGADAVLVAVVVTVTAVTAILHAADRRLVAHETMEAGTGIVEALLLVITATVCDVTTTMEVWTTVVDDVTVA